MQRTFVSSTICLRIRPTCIPTTVVRQIATLVPTDAPESLPFPSPPLRLREYQEECIRSVLSYIGEGHKRLGISLATGTRLSLAAWIPFRVSFDTDPATRVWSNALWPQTSVDQIISGSRNTRASLIWKILCRGFLRQALQVDQSRIIQGH